MRRAGNDYLSFRFGAGSYFQREAFCCYYCGFLDCFYGFFKGLNNFRKLNFKNLFYYFIFFSNLIIFEILKHRKSLINIVEEVNSCLLIT